MAVTLKNVNGELNVVNDVNLDVGTTIFYHQPNFYEIDIHAFVASKKYGGVDGGLDGSEDSVCAYCNNTISGESKMEDGISWTLGVIETIVI